jgi:hypothetical protein
MWAKEHEFVLITNDLDSSTMLSAAGDSKRSPDTGDLLVQIKLVAGGRNRFGHGSSWSPCNAIGPTATCWSAYY